MSYWCPLSTCFRVRGLGGELIVSYWCPLSTCFRVRGLGGELIGLTGGSAPVSGLEG